MQVFKDVDWEHVKDWRQSSSNLEHSFFFCQDRAKLPGPEHLPQQAAGQQRQVARQVRRRCPQQPPADQGQHQQRRPEDQRWPALDPPDRTAAHPPAVAACGFAHGPAVAAELRPAAAVVVPDRQGGVINHGPPQPLHRLREQSILAQGLIWEADRRQNLRPPGAVGPDEEVVAPRPCRPPGEVVEKL